MGPSANAAAAASDMSASSCATAATARCHSACCSENSRSIACESYWHSPSGFKVHALVHGALLQQPIPAACQRNFKHLLMHNYCRAAAGQRRQEALTCSEPLRAASRASRAACRDTTPRRSEGDMKRLNPLRWPSSSKSRGTRVVSSCARAGCSSMGRVAMMAWQSLSRSAAWR